MRKNRNCEFCKEKRMACKIINRNCFKYILKRYKTYTQIITENMLKNIDCFYISENIYNYF